MTDRILRVPLDVDAIAARAEAAPGGQWDSTSDLLWIPFHDLDHDDEFEPGDMCGSGRWIGIQEQWWHAGTGSEDPGAELWTFLAAARDDVLALAAEVRRLRAQLADQAAPAVRKDAA